MFGYQLIEITVTASFMINIDISLIRQYPEYGAYDVLDVFKSDWLNEVWDQRDDDGGQDDYRFVYMGPKGTW